MPAIACLASTPPIKSPVHTAAPWVLTHKNGNYYPSPLIRSIRFPVSKSTQSEKQQSILAQVPGSGYEPIYPACVAGNGIQHKTLIYRGGNNTQTNLHD